jgi:hypothetical protein
MKTEDTKNKNKEEKKTVNKNLRQEKIYFHTEKYTETIGPKFPLSVVRIPQAKLY